MVSLCLELTTNIFEAIQRPVDLIETPVLWAFALACEWLQLKL